MSCVELHRTQAFLDGELDEATSRDAERHLQACPECQAFAAAAAETSDLIRRHAGRQKAPERLRRAVLAGIAEADKPRARRFTGFWLGAGSGAGLMAMAAAIIFVLALPPSTASLADAVINAHTNAMLRGQEIAVVSSNHHTVKPWFSGRIALSPPVADFADQGFALTGGRIQAVDGISMAVVVYRHDAHHVDLFVWPARGALASGLKIRQGYLALIWQAGDLDYAAVSDMDSGELKKFAALVQAERE
jgi:anti-sigma factor (TIGR02949 family)